MDQSPILTGQSDIREVRVVKQGGEDFGAGIIEIGPCKSNLCVVDLHLGDYEKECLSAPHCGYGSDIIRTTVVVLIRNYPHRKMTKQGDKYISSYMIILHCANTQQSGSRNLRLGPIKLCIQSVLSEIFAT